MSDRKASLTFTFRARRDHQEILLYSLEIWGPDQLDRYETTLDNAIRRIRDFPEAGRDCTHLMASGRCARAGHHLIYYTFSDDTVTIHRILHERRHVTSTMMRSDPED